MKNKGFIFDLNGTMIDDMAFHTKIWHQIINEHSDFPISYEKVKVEMYGKNKEVIERIFGTGRFTDDEIDRLSLEKEVKYQKEYLPHLKLLNGLHGFLKTAYAQQIPMGIGSAAIPFNINFVLDNLNIHHFFSSVVSADDVVKSKPHPETFLKVAAALELSPENCIVFEDAPKGVEAAEKAGMPCVVMLTAHDEEDFKKYLNVLAKIKDYTDPFIATLL